MLAIRRLCWNHVFSFCGNDLRKVRRRGSVTLRKVGFLCLCVPLWSCLAGIALADFATPPDPVIQSTPLPWVPCEKPWPQPNAVGGGDNLPPATNPCVRTPGPTPSVTATVTGTPTATSTSTPTPTATSTATITATPTYTPTPTPTVILSSSSSFQSSSANSQSSISSPSTSSSSSSSVSSQSSSQQSNTANSFQSSISSNQTSSTASSTSSSESQTSSTESPAGNSSGPSSASSSDDFHDQGCVPIDIRVDKQALELGPEKLRDYGVNALKRLARAARTQGHAPLGRRLQFSLQRATPAMNQKIMQARAFLSQLPGIYLVCPPSPICITVDNSGVIDKYATAVRKLANSALRVLNRSSRLVYPDITTARKKTRRFGKAIRDERQKLLNMAAAIPARQSECHR